MELCYFAKIISDKAFFFHSIYFSLIRENHSNSSHLTNFFLADWFVIFLNYIISVCGLVLNFYFCSENRFFMKIFQNILRE